MFIYSVVLEIESRALWMLGKHSTTELDDQTIFNCFSYSQVCRQPPSKTHACLCTFLTPTSQFFLLNLQLQGWSQGTAFYTWANSDVPLMQEPGTSWLEKKNLNVWVAIYPSFAPSKNKISLPIAYYYQQGWGLLWSKSGPLLIRKICLFKSESTLK